MIPATPSVEFSCAPSLRHQVLLGLFHGVVLIILLLANLSLLLMITMAVAVPGLYLWQWLVLARRRRWRLRCEQDRWQLDQGDGNWVPVNGEVHYLSRWLVALRLVTATGKRHHLALFSDGMPGEAWRQLHVLARSMVRKPQGRLTMMS